MFRTTILFALVILSFSAANAQINFEKGYFINNIGERTDCLIRNVDWKNNPTSFEYKLSEGGETQVANMGYTQEFAVDGSPKFVRKKVDMNRSSDMEATLEFNREVTFSEEELFLKVLVEGNAILYYYEEGNLRRFFYSLDGSPVRQLVYKRYRRSTRAMEQNRAFKHRAVAENTEYKQQLLNSLECSAISRAAFAKLTYRSSPLTNLFNKYNKCIDPDYIEGNKSSGGFIFNVSVRPGVNFSSLEVISTAGFSGTTFEDKTSFRAGLELEVVLPFNKNKWSIVFEPTYRNYQSDGTGSSFLNTSSAPITADYSSIEFAIGARHSIFINDGSKIFITGYLLNDMETGAKLNTPTEYIINPLSNFAVGLGYKYGNKVSLELRYDDTRELLRYNNVKSKFNNISVVLGYTFL
ncbi:MAG: hypothetical protein ACR2MT_10520 [Aurantibacter sp.]